MVSMMKCARMVRGRNGILVQIGIATGWWFRFLRGVCGCISCALVMLMMGAETTVIFGADDDGFARGSAISMHD
ncbi:hypothetical protein AB4084_02045 [Lysobacter sp. 2RAB21]